jgi:hypothetical protein
MDIIIWVYKSQRSTPYNNILHPNNTVFVSRYKSTGLSLPTDLMQKIDTERGIVSRSRFLLRLIEQTYKEKEKNEVET